MFFKHHAATKAWQDDRSAPQCIVTNKLVQRCFSLHTRCVGLWYETADEKLSMSHLCFSVQFLLNNMVQNIHTCGRVMQKSWLKEQKMEESPSPPHTSPQRQVGIKITVTVFSGLYSGTFFFSQYGGSLYYYMLYIP